MERNPFARALMLLADEAADPAQALELYRRVIHLAEERLAAAPPPADADDDRDGEDIAGEDAEADLLWAHTRVAASLVDLGRREEAVESLLALQRLNPAIFPGEQNRLVCLLLELGRDDEAEAQLQQLEGRSPRLAGPAWNRALLAFRRQGDSVESRRALRIARGLNHRIPEALLDRTGGERPDLSTCEAGEAEALVYASMAAAAWRSTPGALTWLARLT